MLKFIQRPPFRWSVPSEYQPDVKVHEWIKTYVNDEDKKVKWDVVLLGVPLSRSSISVSGASEFPEAFRRSWKNISTYNIDYDIDLKGLKICDLGDVIMHGTDIKRCHANIKEAYKEVVGHFSKALPICIGGDHSITAMTVTGLKESNPAKEIGILQFDTHLDVRDLRDNGPTNGTPIRNLIENGIVKGEHIYNIGLHGFFNGPSLIEFAKEKRINYITLKQAREIGVTEMVLKVLSLLEAKVDIIYVTIDMDVLDITFAPGVPASTPGGMRTDELFDAVFECGKNPKVGALDIVCLDPTKDQKALPTIKTGTITFLSFISGLMKK